jgi:hypothetical protein
MLPQIVGRHQQYAERKQHAVDEKHPSIEVDFPRGPSGGLILSFPEGLLKLPFQELRFDSLLFRTLSEVGLSLRRFPPKKLAGASQISGPPVTRRGRLMRKDPAQLGIYCQARAAAGAN